MSGRVVRAVGRPERTTTDPELTITDPWLQIFTAGYVLVGIGILVEIARRIGMGFITARAELDEGEEEGEADPRFDAPAIGDEKRGPGRCRLSRKAVLIASRRR